MMLLQNCFANTARIILSPIRISLHFCYFNDISTSSNDVKQFPLEGRRLWIATPSIATTLTLY